ncbi:MAG: DUF3999 family protein [Acidobacteriaceae bacterium]
MKLRGALLLLALAVAPQAQHFRYERPLTGTVKTGQTCVVLDAQSYAHAAPELADVRLYRGDAETPYVIRAAAPQEQPQQEIAPLNLGHKGAHTTFEAAMPAGQYSDIDLDITAKDFIATVAVTGAQDESGREGTELGLFTIFDLTGQKLGRSMVLHLPQSDLRYLYFSIEGPVKPEDVHGLTIARVPERQTQYVTIAETAQFQQDGHSTRVRFTVPAHVPVDRIVFVPGATPANFSRDVTVKITAVPKRPPASEDEAPQPATAEGNLLRVHEVRDGHKIDDEHLTVAAPSPDFGDAESTWTIAIDNGDDAPVAWQSVRLEMIERRLCFDAAAGAAYTLFYGDPALAAPRYDYATLFAPEKDAAQAALGPEQANARYNPRPDQRPFTERHPGLLWAALVLVIVVLGLVALRMGPRTSFSSGW